MKAMNKKTLNAVSQVLGVEQKEIKKVVNSLAYKENNELYELLHKRMEKYYNKNDYEGLMKFIDLVFNICLHYLPEQYRIIVCLHALESIQKVDKNVEKINEIKGEL